MVRGDGVAATPRGATRTVRRGGAAATPRGPTGDIPRGRAAARIARSRDDEPPPRRRQLNYFGYYKISGKGKLEKCVYTNNALRHDGDEPGATKPPRRGRAEVRWVLILRGTSRGRHPHSNAARIRADAARTGRKRKDAPRYPIDALLRLKRKSSREGQAAAAATAAKAAAARAARPATARQSSLAAKREESANAAAVSVSPDPRATKRQRSDTEGTIVTVATAETGGSVDSDDERDAAAALDAARAVATGSRDASPVHRGDDAAPGAPGSPACWVDDALDDFFDASAPDGLFALDRWGDSPARPPSPGWLAGDRSPARGAAGGGDPPGPPAALSRQHSDASRPPPADARAAAADYDWAEHPIAGTRAELWIGPYPSVASPF